MSLIYEPKGPAAEYSELAMNHFVGCSHSCTYCCVPRTLRIPKAEFHGQIESKTFGKLPRFKFNVLERLRKEAPKFSGTDKRILLCFACDPYQPLNNSIQITRQVIHILRQYDIPFQVLTKAGKRSEVDLDLYRPCDAYAATLTFWDSDQAIHYEPYAANPLERANVLSVAHAMGIETWVSLEPVIDPEQSLEIIKQTHEFVDLYKIGTLNYQPPPQPIDWRAFGMDAIALCRRYGKPFFIKSSLAKCLDGIHFRNTDNRRTDWNHGYLRHKLARMNTD